MRFLLIFPLLFFFVCSSLVVDMGFAAPQDDAKKQLEVAIAAIVSHVKNPDYKNLAKRQALQEKIKKDVYSIFDFEEFSMRTVGPHWRTFNAAQKKAFSEAFAELLFATYLERIDGYNGETILFTETRSNAAGNRVEVASIVTIENNQKIPMAYRMLPKNSKWHVYDVLIENISLVKNFRSQFGNILNSEEPEVLIARIRERALAVREKTHE